jgi:uncharacterized protein (TIGR02271 family)
MSGAEFRSAEQRREALSMSSTAQWRIGVAVFTGLCALGCLVLAARRLAPVVVRPARPRKPAPAPAAGATALAPPPADHVALTSVEATGEARLRREIVTETRTIAVPVAREELVIEHVGEGGTVIIDGRQLEAGETVRIPLWEERVQVDVTKHALLKEDIVIGKRLHGANGALPDRTQPPDFSLAEGNPS